MLKVVVLFFIIFFASSSSSFAARKVFISADKNIIRADEEIVLNASPSGFLETERIYIKGAFFKEGSSNYFGFTKIGSSWIKNSITALSQREIDVGSWDKLIIVRVDFDDSGFAGIGDYKLKIGFYYINSSGNLSSVNWSENNIPISIIAVPTEPPKADNIESGENEIIDTQEVSRNSVNSNPTKKPTGAKRLNTITPEFDKISHVPRSASEYAKIEPITVNDEIEEDSEVLGSNDTNYPRTLAVSGGLFLIIASFIFFRKELIKRR